jgi:O-antigen ligase
VIAAAGYAVGLARPEACRSRAVQVPFSSERPRGSAVSDTGPPRRQDAEVGPLWHDRLSRLGILLLPIGAVSIRHWLSGFFVALAVLGLLRLNRRRRALLSEERLLLWAMVTFFGVYLITALANGWGPQQTRHLESEVRFILFIPLYLLLREVPGAARALLWGSVLGAVALGTQASWEVLAMGHPRAEGAYSPNLLGPFAAWIAVLVLLLRKQFSGARSWLPVVAVVFAFAALFFSVSRGAYLGFAVMIITWLLLERPNRRDFAALGIALLVAGGLFGGSPQAERVTIVLDDFKAYFAMPDPAAADLSHSAVGHRLEAWRAAWMIFRDHPLTGVGRGNYWRIVTEYADGVRVNRVASLHGHPHNVFFELAASKGILGLLSFLFIVAAVLRIFFKVRGFAPAIANGGIVFVAGFLAFGLTDASPLIKNSYVSFLLFYLALLVALAQPFNALQSGQARCQSVKAVSQ